MPHFYYHVLDGTSVPDRDGVELPDIDAAKVEAFRFAGAVLSDGIDGSVWQGHPWRIVVTDGPSPQGGRTYLTLTLSGQE
jgi:hypothetical protein